MTYLSQTSIGFMFKEAAFAATFDHAHPSLLKKYISSNHTMITRYDITSYAFVGMSDVRCPVRIVDCSCQIKLFETQLGFSEKGLDETRFNRINNGFDRLFLNDRSLSFLSMGLLVLLTFFSIRLFSLCYFGWQNSLRLKTTTSSLLVSQVRTEGQSPFRRSRKLLRRSTCSICVLVPLSPRTSAFQIIRGGDKCWYAKIYDKDHAIWA